MGDEREGLPRFVDGIGPPLAQIAEDYAEERTTHARDVSALIAEVQKLDARVGQLTQELRDAEDAHASDRERLLVHVREAVNDLHVAQRRITELEAVIQTALNLTSSADPQHPRLILNLQARQVLAAVLSTSKEEP